MSMRVAKSPEGAGENLGDNIQFLNRFGDKKRLMQAVQKLVFFWVFNKE